MNIAIFLHSQKEYQDSSLPLPLAPVYSLPQHKWIFSSPSLVPLRKRKENSILYKYIEQFKALSEQKETNNQNRPSLEQNILCLYQKNGYLNTKLKHVFDTIWLQYSNGSALKQKISCECPNLPQEGIQIFKATADSLYSIIQQCKKHPTRQHQIAKHDSINWYQFTRSTIHHNLNIPFYTEDTLHLFKIPQSSKRLGQNTFNLLWSNSYIVFNNGLQMTINQHMKTKAVELAEIISNKLKEQIWRHVEVYIEQVAEMVKDHGLFVDGVKKIVEPNSFRLWFYKKEQNNQIYAIAITDLTLKGVECVLYKDVNLKDQHEEITVPALDGIPEEEMDIVDKYLTNRMKTYSLYSKSTKSINSLAANRQKLKSIALTNKISAKTLSILQKSAETKTKEEPSQIQCACCRHLLLTSEIINQITAKHIEQIKYLRQIKICKNQYDPYDFVKVCSQCYQVYLDHYKSSVKGREKKTVSFYQYKKKKEGSKGQSSKRDIVEGERSKEKASRVTKNSSKRLVKNYSCKTRPKSDFNSKEQTDFDLQSKKTKEIQLPKPSIPAYCLPYKYRKNKTTHTSNTQTFDFQPSLKIPSIKYQFQLQRTMTAENPSSSHANPHESFNKSKSFKLRGRIGSKYPNLISKIILNSNENSENLDNYTEITQTYDQNKLIKDQIITNAIQEYEKLNRNSYKKIVYKNQRKGLKLEITEDLREKSAMKGRGKKKSVGG